MKQERGSSIIEKVLRNRKEELEKHIKIFYEELEKNGRYMFEEVFGAPANSFLEFIIEKFGVDETKVYYDNRLEYGDNNEHVGQLNQYLHPQGMEYFETNESDILVGKKRNPVNEKTGYIIFKGDDAKLIKERSKFYKEAVPIEREITKSNEEKWKIEYEIKEKNKQLKTITEKIRGAK